MHHILLVGVVESLEDLGGDSGCFDLVEYVLLTQLVEKLPALEVFDDDVVQIFRLVELVDLDDVGVVQFDQGVDFFFRNGLPGPHSLGYDFESPVYSQQSMGDLKDPPILPLAQLLLNLVVPLEVMEIVPNKLPAVNGKVGAIGVLLDVL